MAPRKFPRTPHLCNDRGVTSATRDDLVLSAGEARRFSDAKTAVIIEEKIDGANLGISLTENYEFRVQNRSHFVTAASHRQFSELPRWLDAHAGELCALLRPGSGDVLFGEWCYARHSVPYTKLPDYFIAFDFFDGEKATFASRDVLAAKLKDMSICQVPLLAAAKTYREKEEFLDILRNATSSYYDGPVEGLYLRIESDALCLDRAKLVRAGFVQGLAKHWAADGFVKNSLDPLSFLSGPP